jgi:hypothetical protein
MDIEQRAGKQETGEETIALLKGQSLDLTALHLGGRGQMADSISYSPQTWNENSGIIIYADKDGRTFAIPSNDSVRNRLQQDPSFKKAEGKGVWNLNDVDGVWGGVEKNRTNSAFNRWQELASRNQVVQEREAVTMRRGQDMARDMFEAGGQAAEEEAEVPKVADQLAHDIKAGKFGG